jgi:hypothetical protein
VESRALRTEERDFSCGPPQDGRFVVGGRRPGNSGERGLSVSVRMFPRTVGQVGKTHHVVSGKNQVL